MPASPVAASAFTSLSFVAFVAFGKRQVGFPGSRSAPSTVTTV